MNPNCEGAYLKGEIEQQINKLKNLLMQAVYIN